MLGDVFFYVSLCAGGSSWHRLNLEVANREGSHDTIVRIIDHWALRWRLWANFDKVVRHCKRIGAAVLLAWPRFCSYWTEDKVSKFLYLMGYTFTNFDGCMYGHKIPEGETIQNAH